MIQALASKECFPGGELGDFSKIFLGGKKLLNLFFPSWNHENNLFCWNFQNPGGKAPPAPPSDVHEFRKECQAWQTNIVFNAFPNVCYKSHLNHLSVLDKCDTEDTTHVQSSSNKITNPGGGVQICDAPLAAPVRPHLHPKSESISETLEYFRKFFDEAMIECIAEQSNFYAVQTKLLISLMLTCKELEIFLLFYWKRPCVLCLVRDCIGQRTCASNMWVLWWPGSFLNT